MTTNVAPGAVLGGRYQIGAPLGSGGWGLVFEATQLDLGRRVAVKVLREGAVALGDLQRFEREARAAAALGHPNIVQVFDFQLPPGGPPFLVMEHLPGRSLAMELKQWPSLPPGRVVAIARQLLAALEVAHRAGIVHRDVKPENVFLVQGPGIVDFVKLLDFGIAKLDAAREAALTVDGAVIGSPSTMAPEQVTGAPVDARTDLYAVGATMYRALSGRLPFEAASTQEMLVAIRDAHPAPLGALVPGLDPRLEAIVARAMHKDRDGRFPGAEAMRAALNGLGYASGPHMMPAATPPDVPSTILASAPPGTTVPRRSGAGLAVALVLGVAALLAVMAVVAGAYLLSPSNAEASSGGVTDAATADTTPAVTAPASLPTATPAAEPEDEEEDGADASAPRADAPSPRPAPRSPPPGPPMSGTSPKISSIGSRGGTSTADVRAAVGAVMPQITACFVKNEREPPPHEHPSYVLDVDASGAVTSARAERSASPCAKLDACVLGALRTVRFPAGKPARQITIGFSAPVPR